MKLSVFPHALLVEFYSYNPETGEIISRRNSATKRAGEPITSVDKNGYVRIYRNGKAFAGHRLAWQLHYGEPAPCEIDHINGVKHDNRICNLRLATHSQNLANIKSRSKRGCLKGAQPRSNGTFAALITKDGRQKYIGSFATEQEAHEAYMAEARRLHGEFARAS